MDHTTEQYPQDGINLMRRALLVLGILVALFLLALLYAAWLAAGGDGVAAAIVGAITIKHAPASQLPFEVCESQGEGPTIETLAKVGDYVVGCAFDGETASSEKAAIKDAYYLVHAANAYQKLVEALRGLQGLVELAAHAHDKNLTTNHRWVDAEKLLRDLGEAT